MTKTMVLESGGCAWGKCIFCGYSKKPSEPDALKLKAKIDREMLDADYEHLKLFTSGSFFDDKQFPKSFREHLAKKCEQKRVKKLTLESLPQFVTKENLEPFQKLEVEVAIGLETADDELRHKIRKNFSSDQFVSAANTIHNQNQSLRTYLLVNLPFVNDHKKQLKQSFEFAEDYSDSLVLINLLPHSNSELFKMWLAGEWNFMTKKRFHELVEPYADKENVETDEETFRFVPRFPREKKKALKGVSEQHLKHPYYRVWQDWLQRWYEKPDKSIALFLPCSAKKPYSKSKTHTLIYKTIKDLMNYKDIHRIVVSSAGVIPIEFDNYYPFNAYDWDESKETPEIKEKYIQVNKERIKKYLQAHDYDEIVCYFRKDSESFQALKEACDELGEDLEPVLPNDIFEALNELHEKLENI